MLEGGNQKQLKQLGFNRIWDPYSIGTEKAQNILQVTENKDWLPFVDAFGTFCLCPAPHNKTLLLEIQQVGCALIPLALISDATRHDALPGSSWLPTDGGGQ